MQLNPYLFYNGNCEAAFKFYEKVLGARIEAMMRNAEMPDAATQMPADRMQNIMHARMTIDGEVVMASDAPADDYHVPQGFCVSLQVGDPDEAERKFAALAEGGSIEMPIGKTFWARRFGACTDQFGIPWMINCE